MEVDEPPFEQSHEATRRTRGQMRERGGIGMGPRAAPQEVGCRERCLRAVGAGLRDREPRTEPTGRTHRHLARIDDSAVLDELDQDGRARPRGTDRAADHDVVEQPDRSHPSRDDGADPDGHGSAHALREHGYIAVGPRRLEPGRESACRVGGRRGDRQVGGVPDLDRGSGGCPRRRAREPHALAERDRVRGRRQGDGDAGLGRGPWSGRAARP